MDPVNNYAIPYGIGPGVGMSLPGLQLMPGINAQIQPHLHQQSIAEPQTHATQQNKQMGQANGIVGIHDQAFPISPITNFASPLNMMPGMGMPFPAMPDINAQIQQQMQQQKQFMAQQQAHNERMREASGIVEKLVTPTTMQLQGQMLSYNVNRGGKSYSIYNSKFVVVDEPNIKNYLSYFYSVRPE